MNKTEAMSSSNYALQRLESHLNCLKYASPENSSEDIKPLKNKFEGRKIIGMGEATHSSKEFYQLRHRFFKFLVEELDYRIFAWEASFGETLKINNYVVNGEGSAEEALNSVSSPNCKMKEVLNLIEWIREYNKKISDEEKIRFYGFDMQNDIASFTKLREIMEKVDSEFIERNNNILDFIEQGKMMFAEIDEERENELKEFVENLEKRIEKNKEKYLDKISKRDYRLLKQLTVIIDQCRKFCLAVNDTANIDIDSWTFRDKSMAKNISWMMNFEDEDKAFVWAHNAHIKKSGRPENPESKALGYYLDRKYADKYYAIGFDFGTGSFKYLDMESKSPEWDGEKSFNEVHKNTLAEELINLDKAIYFLDLSSETQDKEFRNWRNRHHKIHSTGTYFHLENIEDHYDDMNLQENFDALIFISEVTASEPLIQS